MTSRNFMQGRAIRIEIDGQTYDQWEEATVTRDLKEFAGTFSFNCRDNHRSLKTFDWATEIPPVFQLRPGAQVKIFVHGELVLVGFIETVSPEIDAEEARVAISGKDKAGDLIDCTALPDGPVEFNNVKLEEAAKRIAAPYGLKVRNEIDTGETFARYGVDLTETGLSALEKGARQRQALLLSDGVGGLVITRTGANRAPGDLTLPGNVLSSSGTFTHAGRFSKTTVRGQGEKASGKRDGTAARLVASGDAVKPEQRQAGDGTATQMERAGTAATGEQQDEEVNRYRPKVHLARTKGKAEDCQREADWRSRTARGKSEEISYTVWGFRAGVNEMSEGQQEAVGAQSPTGNVKNGRLWRVNEMVYVSDAYQLIERDMLISKVEFRESNEGRITELTITSPEAFDAEPVKDRRKNKKGKRGRKGKKGKGGALDGTANALS